MTNLRKTDLKNFFQKAEKQFIVINHRSLNFSSSISLPVSFFKESCERGCIGTRIYAASISTCTIVSVTSILWVALYTLITIRIDPFGSRRIVTTPRCIILCMLTWVMSSSVYFSSALLLDTTQHTKVVASLQTIALASTGLCYALTYRAVSKVRISTAMSKERKEENKRVLRSFALVFGTTLFFLVIPLLGYFVEALWRNPCFKLLFNSSSNINLFANSLVYWWRLKEFRSILPCSRKQNAVIPY